MLKTSPSALLLTPLSSLGLVASQYHLFISMHDLFYKPMPFLVSTTFI